MSGPRLPVFVEPLPCAVRGVALEGVIAIEQFSRLAELVVPVEGAEVQARLRFSRDDTGVALVSGVVQAEVELRCDRCMENVGCDLRAELNMAVVRSEDEARSLLGGYDPFILTEPRITVAELLEDDLLLSLPTVACVDFDSCPRRPGLQYGPAPEEAVDDSEPDSPFSVLAVLKSPPQ